MQEVRNRSKKERLVMQTGKTVNPQDCNQTKEFQTFSYLIN